MKKKLRKNVLGFLLGIILIAFPFFKVEAMSLDERKQVFQQAGQAYQKGEYDKAIEGYLSILNQGYENANTYYNLGNCYFKKNMLGKSILFYERADRLIPRDNDLKANFSYAASLVKDNLNSFKPAFYISVLNAGSAFFTINGLTIFLFVVFLLFLLYVILRVYTFFSRYQYFVISGFLIVLIFSLAILYFKVERIGKEAIVVNELIEARFEPSESATTHFSLFEGMKVLIINQSEGWYKIKRVDNKVGWVRCDSVEKI